MQTRLGACGCMEDTMSVPSAEPAILIVDTLPLRSFGLTSILSRLDHSAAPSKFRLTVCTPDQAEQWIDADAKCQMVIFNAGGASIADCENLQRIKVLRALAPDVPLVIFSERSSREEIISALNVGAQGVIYAGMNAELAIQAFSFMLHGGSYFPSAMRPKWTFAGTRHSAINRGPTPPCAMGGSNGDAENLEDAGSIKHSLTARQKAVLKLLSCGESNKVIARQLGMKVGTVKVHVRQIMRKFGVINRTQIAVVCATGTRADGNPVSESKLL